TSRVPAPLLQAGTEFPLLRRHPALQLDDAVRRHQPPRRVQVGGRLRPVALQTVYPTEVEMADRATARVADLHLQVPAAAVPVFGAREVAAPLPGLAQVVVRRREHSTRTARRRPGPDGRSPPARPPRRPRRRAGAAAALSRSRRPPHGAAAWLC